MSGRREFYIGRSGQLVVLAEFLRRGYNAAIPEVDMGESHFMKTTCVAAASACKNTGTTGRLGQRSSP